MFKKLLSMALVCVLSLTMGVSAFAAEAEPHLPIQSTFELVNGETQSQEITLADGSSATIVLEKITSKTTKATDTSSKDVSDGEWKVYFYTGIGNFSYYVTVDNSKIVDAYDMFYFTIGINCTGAELTHNSTSASMYCTFQTPIWDIISWNGYLNCRIEGNQFIVSII